MEKHTHTYFNSEMGSSEHRLIWQNATPEAKSTPPVEKQEKEKAGPKEVNPKKETGTFLSKLTRAFTRPFSSEARAAVDTGKAAMAAVQARLEQAGKKIEQAAPVPVRPEGPLVPEAQIKAQREAEAKPVKEIADEFLADRKERNGLRKKPESYAESVRKLADQGNFMARLFLGVVYSSGLIGELPDPQKAKYWLEQARALPHSEADRKAIDEQIGLVEETLKRIEADRKAGPAYTGEPTPEEVKFIKAGEEATRIWSIERQGSALERANGVMADKNSAPELKHELIKRAPPWAKFDGKKFEPNRPAPKQAPTSVPDRSPGLRPEMFQQTPAKAPSPTQKPQEAPAKAPAPIPTQKPTVTPAPTPGQKPQEAPTKAPAPMPPSKPTEAAKKAPTPVPDRSPGWRPPTNPDIPGFGAYKADPLRPEMFQQAPTQAPAPTQKPPAAPTQAPTQTPAQTPAQAKGTGKPAGVEKGGVAPSPAPTAPAENPADRLLSQLPAAKREAVLNAKTEAELEKALADLQANDTAVSGLMANQSQEFANAFNAKFREKKSPLKVKAEKGPDNLMRLVVDKATPRPPESEEGRRLNFREFRDIIKAIKEFLEWFFNKVRESKIEAGDIPTLESEIAILRKKEGDLKLRTDPKAKEELRQVTEQRVKLEARLKEQKELRERNDRVYREVKPLTEDQRIAFGAYQDRYGRVYVLSKPGRQAEALTQVQHLAREACPAGGSPQVIQNIDRPVYLVNIYNINIGHVVQGVKGNVTISGSNLQGAAAEVGRPSAVRRPPEGALPPEVEFNVPTSSPPTGSEKPKGVN